MVFETEPRGAGNSARIRGQSKGSRPGANHAPDRPADASAGDPAKPPVQRQFHWFPNRAVGFFQLRGSDLPPVDRLPRRD
jgi:hypothetical protein